MNTNKLTCILPFSYIEIHPGGWVYTCCPHWTKAGAIGNLKKQSIEKVWNSQRAQFIRKKIYQNELSFVCNMLYCPIAASAKSLSLEDWVKKEPFLEKITSDIKRQKTKLSSGPFKICIADSGECNLRCKMCLSNENFNPKDKELSKIVFNEVLPSLLPYLAHVTLSGNGEVFFRKETREFLQKFDAKKYPHISFDILTNGLLLNQKMWNSIKHNRIRTINVSVDAANAETYQKIRHGSWKILQENLNLISGLRKRKIISFFRISMVVMKTNFREMKDFAQMGKKLGCDQVIFQKIVGINRGCLEENFNLYKDKKIIEQIKEILKDPVFKDPIMDIRQMESYREQNFSWTERIGLKKLKYRFLSPFYQLYWQLPSPLRVGKKLRRRVATFKK